MQRMVLVCAEAEDVYRLLQPVPFRPVRVYLKDGRTFDIPVRELVVVGVNYLKIGLQAPGEPEGICASSVKVPLTDVCRLELLFPSPPVVT
jgi:hypothetical protein